MVTVAIATILASLAVPSFRTTLVGQTVESTADTLVSDIRFARSEAIKRTNRVTICGSSTGTSCYGANAWHNGWIVFVDDDGDGVVDTGDVVLRVQSAVTGISLPLKPRVSHLQIDVAHQSLVPQAFGAPA